MPLSNVQINWRLFRGERMYMAMLMRDGLVIKTLYEPMGATQFIWDEKEGKKRRYLTQGGATIKWSGRDIYIYDFDTPIPYRIADGYESIINNELGEDASQNEEREQIMDGEVETAVNEENIPAITQGLNSSEFDDVVAANLVGIALSELRGHPKEGDKLNFIGILISVVILIVIIWSLFGGGL